MSADSQEPTESFLEGVRRTAVFNFAGTGVSAVTGVLLARWLGPSGRGDYAAVTSFFIVALLVSTLGIESAVVYYVSRDHASRGNYVRTATVTLLPLFFVASIVSVAIGRTLGTSDSRLAAFAVLPLSFGASMAMTPALFALQALNLRWWSVVRFAQPVAFFGGVILIRLLTSLTAPLVILIMGGSLILQAGFAWLVYRRYRSPSSHFDSQLVRPMLRFGILNMWSTAPQALNSRVDQVVLAGMVSSPALGQYAVAVSLSVIAAPLVVAFGYVAFPRLAGGRDALETIRTALRGSWILSTACVAAVTLAGPLIVPRLFGRGYELVPELILVLAPGAVVMVLNQVLVDLLRGLGKPGIAGVCQWVGVPVLFGGLALAVPLVGVIGAAATSSIVYLLVYVLLRHAVSREVAELTKEAAAHSPTESGS